MMRLPTAAPALLLACALRGNDPASSTTTPVWVRSHNHSSVDIYLLCGDHDATWLGNVPERGSDAFEIAAERRECWQGLNFFLVVKNASRGYWVGPMSPRSGDGVQLVIERYAGLSTLQVYAMMH